MGAIVSTVSVVPPPTSNSEILLRLEIITLGLDDTKREEVCQLLADFPDITQDTFGCTKEAKCTMKVLKGVHPIVQGYYKTNPDKVQKIEEQVKLQRELGLIERSNSQWPSSVILVPKECGGRQALYRLQKIKWCNPA
ncbi:uncharacterized protein [Macrobrachium rosenbergii]|uniref:uncharacterized protein n=1 Tax=Macrobrachium rosenbergii TaxID=79674 RepID=UPI0034D6A715